MKRQWMGPETKSRSVQTKFCFCISLCQINTRRTMNYPSDQETQKHGTGPSPTNLMGMEHQMTILRENWTSSVQVLKPVFQRCFETVNAMEYLLFIPMRIRNSRVVVETIFAVKQHRNYGAVAKWCKNKSQDGTVESQNQDSSCIVPAQFVSHLIKHETSDLRCLAGRDLLRKQAARYRHTP